MKEEATVYKNAYDRAVSEGLDIRFFDINTLVGYFITKFPDNPFLAMLTDTRIRSFYSTRMWDAAKRVVYMLSICSEEEEEGKCSSSIM